MTCENCLYNGCLLLVVNGYQRRESRALTVTLSGLLFSIRQAAFDCLMTFRQHHLKPYEENFAHLLDPKMLRAELVLFGIDEQTTVLTSEHRPHVIPILMRLLQARLDVNVNNAIIVCMSM